jgi:ABC-type phosphate transport system ATPase subunit
LPGHLVEAGPTGRLFTHPAEPATERYLTGG